MIVDIRVNRFWSITTSTSACKFNPSASLVAHSHAKHVLTLVEDTNELLEKYITEIKVTLSLFIKWHVSHRLNGNSAVILIIHRVVYH